MNYTYQLTTSDASGTSFTYVTDGYIKNRISLNAQTPGFTSNNVTLGIVSPNYDGYDAIQDDVFVPGPQNGVYQYLFPLGAFGQAGVYDSDPAQSGHGTLTVTAPHTYAFTGESGPFSGSFNYVTQDLVSVTPSQALKLANGTENFSETGIVSVVLEQYAGIPLLADVVVVNFQSFIPGSTQPGPTQSYYFEPGALAKVGTHQTIGKGGGTGTLVIT